ncbi:CHAT domain-containing protein [Streptomyces zaomyceticus]|uniref:CHAT domain-containing protein n=1 Tax=Streptomyces zaomyceticus TaxID=68286 RepID=UPI0036A57078
METGNQGPEGSAGELARAAREMVRRSEGARVLPRGTSPVPGPPAAERDLLIEELRLLVPRLTESPPDDEALLPTCLARLGALIGARWTEHGDPGDREEGMALLRRAREDGLLGVGPHTAAARDLLLLLVGPIAARESTGLGGVQNILDASVPEQNGGPGLIEAAPEIERLVHEIGAATPGGLPPAMAEFLTFQTDLQAALVSGDGAGVLGLMNRLDTLDPGVLGPMAPMVAMLRNMLPTGTNQPSAADVRLPTAEEQQGLRSLLGLMAETARPGALSAEQISGLIEEAEDPGQQAGHLVSDPLLAIGHALLGGRTGDAGRFEQALRLLRRAAEGQTEDEDFPWFVRGVLPGLLAGSALTGGSRADLAAAEKLLAESLAPGTGPLIARQPPDRPGADELLRMNRNMLLLSELTRASDAHDVPALEKTIGDILDLLDELEDVDAPEAPGAAGPPGVTGLSGAVDPSDPSDLSDSSDAGDLPDPSDAAGPSEGRAAPGRPPRPDDPDARDARRFMPLFLLGYAQLALARSTSDAGVLRGAVHHLDQAYAAAGANPFAQKLMDALWAPLLALTSFLDPEPERVAAAVAQARASLEDNPVFADQRTRTRMGIAMALALQYRSTGDPAVLDEAITELEHARSESPTDTAQATSALHWDLAEAYALRARLGPDPVPDLARAVADTRDSLRATAADVLLQEGVQHGLEVARGGAARGLLAASWAVRAGRPDEAVACLEAGRALVLAAAAVSATVPERLAALGEEELARQWREARSGATDTRAEAGSARLLTALLDSPLDQPRLPSGLRRRALELLRGQGGGQDGRVPEVAELRDAVARSGADALVYLLPGEDETAEAGWALFLVPDRPPWALPLPALSGPGRAPVAAYLEATGAQSSARRGAERWEAALDALCDWAGTGIMGPVLDELGLWERGLREAGLLTGADSEAAAGPVRLTLVACGNLGVVPWQAARVAVPERWRAAGAPETVRACEPAVLTYAASGREFLRAVLTRRLPLVQGQALVCVPADLDMAEDEVLAVRDAYYPEASLYGEFDTLGLEPALPRGTPAEVLGLLGAPEPGARPVAVVHLVCHGRAGADPGSSVLELGRPVGADPEAGWLSVTRLLDTPAGPEGAGRPLVVLSACETDLSTRDHDEALTVTTAFVHGLAADAVGSRWQVGDDASAVLMTVFHHHVAAGLAPPDALRAAQRWMLAPASHRPPVTGLTPPLLRTAALPELTGPAFWGAFIHQGNPTPLPGGTSLPAPGTRAHHGEGEPTA